MTVAATTTRVCAFGRGCTQPGAYVITFDPDFVGGSYVACVDCTAEVRSNDPLEYIQSVRSLDRPA